MTRENLHDKLSFLSWSSEENNTREVEKLRECMLLAIEQELNQKQKNILTMYYLQHKTMDQIAFDLGVNKSTVSRSVRRSVERLQKVRNYADVLLRS